jgi:hypothetical protein
MCKRGTDSHLRVDTNSTQGILSCSVFKQSHSEPGKFLSLLVEIYVPSPHTADCLHGATDRGWWQTGRGIIMGNTMRRATVVVLREVCRPYCSQLWYMHCCNNKRWNPIESFFLVVVGAKEASNNRQQCAVPHLSSENGSPWIRTQAALLQCFVWISEQTVNFALYSIQ